MIPLIPFCPSYALTPRIDISYPGPYNREKTEVFHETGFAV